MKGKIVRLSKDQGRYGFIRPDDASVKDHFFHASSLVNEQFGQHLEGSNVEFETRDSSKGPRAENIKVLA